MWHESWHGFWVTAGVMGAVLLPLAVLGVLLLVPWRRLGRRAARIRVRRPMVPVWLLRAWTWRRRRRVARSGAPMAPDHPLAPWERVAIADLERRSRL